ncbi:MAG: hypothetical protein ACREIM_01235 [Nitrospiraceae bacterium]
MNGGVTPPRSYDTPATVTGAGLLGVLMAAGLVLSGYMTPVLAQPRSDPEQDLFPANLLLELTDEHTSGDGRQVIATPLSPSRETFNDLLFIERAGQQEIRHLQTETRDRPKNRTPRSQTRVDAEHRMKLNQ